MNRPLRSCSLLLLAGFCLAPLTEAATSDTQRYYDTYLSKRDYSRFGVVGEGDVVRPFVTAAYYAWYHRNQSATNPWGRISPERLPSPLPLANHDTSASSLPWLAGSADLVPQTPLLGFYDDLREPVRRAHLTWAANAGIHALVVSQYGDLAGMLKSVIDMGSPVRVIPLLEAVTQPGGQQQVSAALRKINDLFTRHPTAFLTYGTTSAGGRIPVVYLYKKALSASGEALGQACLDAYSGAFLQLADEGRQFIAIADVDICPDGRASTNTQQADYLAAKVGPSCKVFDGFLPYHMIFRLKAQLDASKTRSPSTPHAIDAAGLTALQTRLEANYRLCRDYLTGNTPIAYPNEPHLSSSRPTKPKICGLTMMPGFDNQHPGTGTGNQSSRFQVERGDQGNIYTQFWQAARKTFPSTENCPGIVMITSFNEHYEGSGIEPTVGTGSLYLELTRKNALSFGNQPSNRLEKRILQGRDGKLAMIRYGWTGARALPTGGSQNQLVDLTAMIRDLNGSLWRFNERDQQVAFAGARSTDVRLDAGRTAEHVVAILAGTNSWQAGTSLIMPASSAPRTVTIQRRAGSDPAIFYKDTSGRYATMERHYAALPYEHTWWLTFIDTSGSNRSAEAIFDITAPGFATSVTVKAVPADDRISLSNGVHLTPWEDRTTWNGAKGATWYHRFDGRPRVEAVFGIHHLVVFLDRKEAVVDGRCISLPEQAVMAGTTCLVPTALFWPLVSRPTGSG